MLTFAKHSSRRLILPPSLPDFPLPCVKEEATGRREGICSHKSMHDLAYGCLGDRSDRSDTVRALESTAAPQHLVDMGLGGEGSPPGLASGLSRRSPELCRAGEGHSHPQVASQEPQNRGASEGCSEVTRDPTGEYPKLGESFWTMQLGGGL